MTKVKIRQWSGRKLQLLMTADVWLRLGADMTSWKAVFALGELVESGRVEVLVPEQVWDEFTRREPEVAEEHERRLFESIALVMEDMEIMEGLSVAEPTLEKLLQMKLRISTRGNSQREMLACIRDLLNKGRRLPVSEAVASRAAERHAAGLAPCHHSAGTLDGAVLVELYAEAASCRRATDVIAFVTDDTDVFSASRENSQEPHRDLAKLFDGQRSVFAIDWLIVLQRFAPDALKPRFQISPRIFKQRALHDVAAMVAELWRLVTLDHHLRMRSLLEQGRAKTGLEEPPSEFMGDLQRMIDKAQASGRGAGLASDHLWSDFELGKLYGKLSALEWVGTGELWDKLQIENWAKRIEALGTLPTPATGPVTRH